MSRKLILTLAVLVTVALLVAGCSTSNSQPNQSSAPASGNNADTQALQKKVGDLEAFADTQKKSINPGLGTIMIEYSQRMAKLWFAGEAQNWDLAAYNLDEMKEIQEVGEIDRPKRADALKAFESNFLDPLDKAIGAKDKAAFEVAYKKAVDGCNSCHVNTKSDAFKNGYGFIKFQIPKNPPVDYQDYSAK